MSELFTKEQLAQMVENFRANAIRHETGEPTIDFKPVVKLFVDRHRSVALTEYDPEFVILFGLCDMGFGFPEFRNVALEGALPVGAITELAETKTLSE